MSGFQTQVIIRFTIVFILAYGILVFIKHNDINFFEWIKLNWNFLGMVRRGFIIPSGPANLSLLGTMNDLQNNYGKMTKANILGETMHVILDSKLEASILMYPPTDNFGPGKFKKVQFQTFIPENLGILEGENWKVVRKFNERVLELEKPNATLSIVHSAITTQLSKSKLPVNSYDFEELAEKISFALIFGRSTDFTELPFETLRDSQTQKAIQDGTIDKDLKKRYDTWLIPILLNPKPEGLIGRILEVDYENFGYMTIADQVPHWLFPARNIILFLIPVYLILINSDSEVYYKIKEEVLANEIELLARYTSTYLHHSVLETVRLFNIVTTLMRTVKKNTKIAIGSETFEFKKSTPENPQVDQVFMLFSKLLRSKKYFKKPNKFDPDRWTRDSPAKDYPEFPFSIGPQTCPGRNVSLILMKVMIAILLKSGKYTLKKTKGINLNHVPYSYTGYYDFEI